MQYDPVGNLTFQEDQDAGVKKELSYDSNNRITQVTDPDTSSTVGEYWYDDDGFRVRKLSTYTIGSTTKSTELIYPSLYFGIKNGDPHDDEQWNVINNIYLNGVRIAAAVPNGETLFYLGDQVDSVKLVLNDDGNPVSRMEHLPYGETWDVATDDNHAPKFNAQEFDKETQFYYYNARYYDAQVSRFVTADTIIDGEHDTQGWNRYAYVKGNPVRYSDPSGNIIPLIGAAIFLAKVAFDIATSPDDIGCGAGEQCANSNSNTVQNTDFVDLKRNSFKKIPDKKHKTPQIDGGKSNSDFYVKEDGTAIPSTGYKYFDSKYADETMNTMETKKGVTYFGFDDFGTAKDARNAYQIDKENWSNARAKGRFDTLQIIDDIKIPLERGGNGPNPEPITRSYREYGDGGYRQAYSEKNVKFDRVELMPEE